MKRSAVRPSPLFLSLLAVTVAGAVLTLFDESRVALIGGTVLFVLGGWAVSLCLHEFGHAIVAYRGGDHAVRAKGYLTLDIRRYTDPVLSIVLPLVLLAFGGIRCPAARCGSTTTLRDRRVESMVSLAGPLSNLLLGFLLAMSVALFRRRWAWRRPVLPGDAPGAGVRAEHPADPGLTAGARSSRTCRTRCGSSARRPGSGRRSCCSRCDRVPTVARLFFDASYAVFGWSGARTGCQRGQRTFMF
ncbi:site-2 protease family protein [Saccharothrix sp. MB29]|nr:site-2 protease family protein [Saccharothrix sp. MB29]